MKFLLFIILIWLLALILVALVPKPAHAGTNFMGISQSTMYLMADKVAEQIKEAKEASQRGLSKEELQKMKDKADEVMDKASSSLDFYTWILGQLKTNMKSPDLFHNDMAMLSEQMHRDNSGLVSKDDMDKIRVAVESKDYDKAKELINVAAMITVSSTTRELWHP